MRSRVLLFVSLGLVGLVSTACHRHRDRDRGARQPNDVASTNTTTAPADPPPPDPNATSNVVSADGSFVCPGGSVVQGDGCVCPANTSWIANQCQSCPGGSVAQGDGCVCPANTSWSGESCQQVAVASPAPVQQPPVERPRPSKRSAWIPRPPEPPQAPNVNIVVGNVTNHIQQQIPPPSGGSGPSTPVQSPPSSSPPSRGGGGGGSVPPNTRVSVAECRNGMVRGPNGISCQCPAGQEWGGGQCVVTCHPTQVRHGNSCTCPKDTRWNGSRCELWQECRAGEVRMGASCIPGNTKRR